METKKLQIEDNKTLSPELLDGEESDEVESPIPEDPQKDATPININEAKDFFIFENAKAGVRIQLGSATLNVERLSNLAYQFLILTTNPDADQNETADYLK